MEAVYQVRRTGVPWRDLSHEFGKWNSVFNRYADWTDLCIQEVGC
ncbi:MAG: transposase [Chloroflexi bacterium]|nr:transposase [Chloroflexota bacterium]MBP8059746.1 transposase [Chloroflexota bacterium]